MVARYEASAAPIPARSIKHGPAARDHAGLMHTATDTFADFVDRLASAMQDDEIGALSGEALAASVGFSRFHFDRIIRSVAGESPVGFRRRILLERAAFRMLTTDAPLLDVAVEAGYGSHEAFTRAFTRAFDATPGSWRRQRDGQFRIDAASDVHFHPPGSIRLPSRRKVTEMDVLTKMVEHHIWLTGELIRVAAELTPEQLDQRIEMDVDDDEQTIRSLLSRLVGQMAMWNTVMAGGEYDMSVEADESLASLRQRLSVEGPKYLAHVREIIAEDRMDETFVHASHEPVEVISYGGNLAHVLTFAAYRRTLVLLALNAHGRGELGWGDPRHWVVDAG